MVQGHASEEKLIASAKEVAGSTAQLLMACKVKADPGSVAMQRLQVSESFLFWGYVNIVESLCVCVCVCFVLNPDVIGGGGGGGRGGRGGSPG